MELLPTKATFAPGEAIVIEVRDLDEPIRLSLSRLSERVAEVQVAPDNPFARFDPQPEGGYGIDGAGVHTAVDVLADPLRRPRYGFVSDYSLGRPVSGVRDNIRRLHLNAVQFYDWMYRHARLLPPGDEYDDPLGRTLSLATVRALIEATEAAGSLPFAYAAVYAVGRDEWPSWQAHGLYEADGRPWTLGEDFLWIVDPTNGEWQEHVVCQLREAQSLGFRGFHLDQYGHPKSALRDDGTVVRLADAFPELIDFLASELPDARLIFNNVNDFPTWTTTSADQAVTYVEVWSPHDRLRDVAQLIRIALLLAPERPVVVATYLPSFASDDLARARSAQSLLLATVFSHGATAILHGEENAVLTEAYYVRHTELDMVGRELTRRYYDFAVRYGDLLFDPRGADITSSYLGGVNEDVRVHATVPVTSEPEPGALSVRVMELPDGMLIHLIELATQADDVWHTGKNEVEPLTGVRVSIRRVDAPVTAFVATPDEPVLRRLDATSDGDYDAFDVPPFGVWSMIWLPTRAETAVLGSRGPGECRR